MKRQERAIFAQEIKDAAGLELSALADFAKPAFEEVTEKTVRGKISLIEGGKL